MEAEQKEKLTRFRKWLVVQKFTLLRGYGWTQCLLMGFLAASQLKLLFPTFFDGIGKFIALIILSVIGLWSVGYIDKRMKFLHTENNYATETNPFMTEIANNIKDIKDQKKDD